jgi:dienelactone hydrolase
MRKGEVVTDVILFHHALGVTEGVLEFADQLRSAGHQVTVPDLFEGRTFTSIDDGVGYARQTGFGTIMERGQAAAEALPAEIVYAGFSLGVLPAQMLAQTRAGAKGALLFDACLPVSEFGGEWPPDVPVQIHGMDSDAFFAEEGDLDAAKDLVAMAKDAELFLYPGDKHLFADSSLPSYDKAAATLLRQRVLDFLGRLG